MPPKRARQVVADDSDEEDVAPVQRRRLAPASDSEEDEAEDDNRELILEGSGGDSDKQNVKRFVRYALSCEYQRLPIRRAGILEKVFNGKRVNFKRILDLTQKDLRRNFGMELVPLPAREKITMKEKKAALKTKNNPKTITQYALVSTLPAEYLTPTIMPPSIIGSASEEAEYTGLCTMIVALISVSPEQQMHEAKLESVLGRLNCGKNMGTLDSTSNLLKKMMSQGYIHKVTDRNNTDEEQVTWIVGGRGKAQIGKEGVIEIFQKVYGADAPPDLVKRLNATLGAEVKKPRNGDEDSDDAGPPRATQKQKQKQKRRKSRRADDDD